MHIFQNRVSKRPWLSVLVEAAVERFGGVAQHPEQRKPPAVSNSQRRTAFVLKVPLSSLHFWVHEDRDNLSKRNWRYMVYNILWRKKKKKGKSPKSQRIFVFISLLEDVDKQCQQIHMFVIPVLDQGIPVFVTRRLPSGLLMFFLTLFCTSTSLLAFSLSWYLKRKIWSWKMFLFLCLDYYCSNLSL